MNGLPITSAVVVGGSAGASEVLSRLLADLPDDFAAPIAVVIHLARRQPSALPEALGRRSRLPVREPLDKEPLAPATVYVAPPNYHLLIERGPAFALSTDEPVYFSLPSIDVLFESAADVFGPRLVAILLSGANQDGARGLKAVSDAGGLALVQAPEEAAFRAMPEAGLAMCPHAQAMGVEALAQLLRERRELRARAGEEASW